MEKVGFENDVSWTWKIDDGVFTPEEIHHMLTEHLYRYYVGRGTPVILFTKKLSAPDLHFLKEHILDFKKSIKSAMDKEINPYYGIIQLCPQPWGAVLQAIISLDKRILRINK